MLGSVGQADLAANADLVEGLLEDFELAAGEALVLVDNNSFSTGIAALAVADCETLLDGLDVAGALDLEAFAANLGLIDEAVAEARPYPGLRATLHDCASCSKEATSGTGRRGTSRIPSPFGRCRR